MAENLSALEGEGVPLSEVWPSNSPKPNGAFCAFARPTVVPELRRLIEGGGDNGGLNGLPPSGLLGDAIGVVKVVALAGDPGVDEPALAIRRSRSRASLRCCVVKRRSVCWV